MQAPPTVLCAMLVLSCVMAAVATVTFGADLDHPHGFEPSAYSDRAAWERRRDFLRHQAMVAQGVWPMPEKTPLHAVVHGKIDRGDYTIEKVFFASLPGHYVSGNLYRPKGGGGKRPAVLMPHGHWPGGRFVWRSDAEAKKEIDAGAEQTMEAARSPLQANCAAVARMGCVVFHYDAVGSGDSEKIPHREGFTDAEATLRLQSFMGLQTWNSIRALDFVLSLSDVDETRVAVTGSSGGATQAIALAAIDDRVDVTFPMVMVSMNMQGGCICENAPLYRVDTNNVELACLFAPKPQGVASANDWTHDFLTRGLPEMKAIYRLYDAEANVEGNHVDFGHNHNLHSRLLQYRFLNKHLKLGQPEPIEEKPFEPVPPEQLSVYDEQHPMPADFVDAGALRQWMTQASDEQLAKLSREDYVRTVRTALKAMLVDEGRDPAHTSHTSSMPRDWNGKVVIWAGGDSGARPPRALDRAALYIPLPPPDPATTATTKPADPKRSYAGFTLGYNRSAIAREARGLLDMVAQIRRSHAGVKSISLMASGDAAPAALLARAVAGEAIDRAAIDLGQFDFDRVQKDDDPNLLPGALKYGGIYGFVPLCDSGATLIFNAPRETRSTERARTTPEVTIDPKPRDTEEVMKWLVENR